MNIENTAVSDAEILKQLRLGEDSRWEFKEVRFSGSRPASSSRDDLADEIAAFANAAGGFMLLGVSDQGEVQEMSREQLRSLEKLAAELSNDSIKPPVRIRTFFKQLEGHPPFLLVEIPKSDFAHRSPGGQFVRVGRATRMMPEEEWRRLEHKRSQAQLCWFDQQTVENTGSASLEETLWKPLLSASARAEPEISLEKLKLLARDDRGALRATVAGVLLCTEHPEQWLPNAMIVAACYRGRDPASGQLDAQEITGPIYKQVEYAMNFAIRNMRVAARKTPKRMDLPQYSEQALFEALVNAVVHRDYSRRGSRIRLRMFEDRLELCSPGGLPNNLTVESMGERQSTRNEVLVSAFRRLSTEGVKGSGDREFFMEQRGDGVSIIQQKTEEVAGKRPEFRLLDDSELLLTLPAASLEETSADIVITVYNRGQPMAGVDLLAVFPNKTWQRATTNEQGKGRLRLHSTHLPMTLFAAAPECAAHIERGWIPAERRLALEMLPLEDGGSVIFPEAVGSVPGLQGRLNPIRDHLDRTYLYASNMAINNGQRQPVHFTPGEELLLTDAEGEERIVRIMDIVGRAALLEYRPKP